MTVTLYQIVEQSSRVALAQQNGDGTMPPGHNGPRHDPATPVRNTAHWLITFLKAYDICGQAPFLQAARKAAGYLRSEKARPMGAAFWHLKNPEKNFGNGLVGQAWTIEALASFATAVEDEPCRELAESVFLLHPFDERLGLWRRLNVDGSYRYFDRTFNHQLWFAASGALLLPARDRRIAHRIARFMEALPDYLALHPSGAIRHTLFLSRSGRGARAIGQRWLGRLFRRRISAAEYSTAVGYHAFNLYAFALLKQQFPTHPFWGSDRLRRALAFVKTGGYVAGLEGNRYGYPYNPVGFEVPFALQAFGDGVGAKQEHWCSEQLRRCYDFRTHQMNRDTADPETLAARLYEATRLPDVPLQLA
jgi:hypothetical protein